MTEEQKQRHLVEQPRPSSAAVSDFALAKVYLESGAYREAEAYARKSLLTAAVSSGVAKILLAETLWRQGRQQEAVSVREGIEPSGDLDLQAELRALDSRLLVESGNYRECLAQFGLYYLKPASCTGDIRVQENIAQCYSRLDDLGKARNALEWVVTESQRLGCPQSEARALMHIALLDRTEGHWPAAEQRLLKARSSFARLGLFRSYVLATLNLGLQRLWQGQLRSADETLSEAARLAAEMGDIRVESTARADRGLALVRLRQLSEARTELSQALRLARRQASPRRVAIALEYTGELHLAAGEYDRAWATLSRALAIANRIAPEGDIVPEVLRRLAEVALGRDDAEESLRLADDAVGRANRLGDKYECATAIRVRGQALLKLGKGQEGKDLLRSALAVFMELGEIFERDRILALLGEKVDHALPAHAGCESPLARQAAPAVHRSRRAEDPLQPEELQSLLLRHGMIGSSRTLKDVMRQAALVAPIQLPVLIQGETGTGKELLARAVHVMGTPPSSPFVAFNCATCPSDLLDAELFGHARGAFTGATQGRDGLVRSAQGGTLFLDEIGELREESQARLLRLLDSGEVRPLGSDHAMRVQVRIIAATHADLKERIRVRRFRPDLFFRLAGVRLVLPPLRERPEDIRELVEHFVGELRKIHPKFAGFSESALRALETFSWPGNVRQLKMEVERIAALTEPGHLVRKWVPLDSETPTSRRLPAMMEPEEAVKVLRDPSRLLSLLRQCDGQIVVAARVLGRSRSQIYRIFKEHGIDPSEFRAK
jgi:DNA-binding NtrC family response regulator/tetratricopeptide (TPR) repeat protein